MIDLGLFALSGGTTPSVPTPADWSSVINNVTSVFTTANIVTTLASVVASGIAFVLLWWSVRLAFRSIMGAVKHGSLSINPGRRRRR